MLQNKPNSNFLILVWTNRKETPWKHFYNNNKYAVYVKVLNLLVWFIVETAYYILRWTLTRAIKYGSYTFFII